MCHLCVTSLHIRRTSRLLFLLQAQRREEDERIARENEEVRASRKRRKEEQKLKKREKYKQNQSTRGRGGRGGGRAGGSVVNEFSSGKKEIWVMPGMSDTDSGMLVVARESHDSSAQEAESYFIPPPQVSLMLVIECLEECQRNFYAF